MRLLLCATLLAALATAYGDRGTNDGNNSAMAAKNQNGTGLKPPMGNTSDTYTPMMGNSTMPAENFTVPTGPSKGPGGNYTEPSAVTSVITTPSTTEPTTEPTMKPDMTESKNMTTEVPMPAETTTVHHHTNSSAVVLTSLSAVSLCVLSLVVAS